MKKLLLLFVASISLWSCSNTTLEIDNKLLDEARYDTILNGKCVKLFTLSNNNIGVQITNYGGRIATLLVPDRDGVMRNIHWREGSIKELLELPYIYSGTIIGRAANRTGNGGMVEIDGEQYQLSVNDDNIHYAGGTTGMSFDVWDAEQGVNNDGEPMLILKYFSPDGHEGYPGNLNVEAIYTLKDDALELAFRATTDAPTFINMTSHPFFNLHGELLTSTNSHILRVNADNYTPSASNGLLTGEIAPVAGTPFDFRGEHTIGERVDLDHEQLKRPNGYDANFIINKEEEGEMTLIAELYEPATGIALELHSDQSAMQLFGGPFQSEKRQRANDPRPLRYGVALEAQDSPNAPNCPAFRSTILYPGEIYSRTIIYKFATK